MFVPVRKHVVVVALARVLLYAAEVVEYTIQTGPQRHPMLGQVRMRTRRQSLAHLVVPWLQTMRPSVHTWTVVQPTEWEAPQRRAGAEPAAETFPKEPLKVGHNSIQYQTPPLHLPTSEVERTETSESIRLSSYWLVWSVLGHILQPQIHHRPLH